MLKRVIFICYNDISRTLDSLDTVGAISKQAHKYFRTIVPLQVALAGQLMLIFPLVSFYLGFSIPDHLILIQVLVSYQSRQTLLIAGQNYIARRFDFSFFGLFEFFLKTGLNFLMSGLPFVFYKHK